MKLKPYLAMLMLHLTNPGEAQNYNNPSLIAENVQIITPPFEYIMGGNDQPLDIIAIAPINTGANSNSFQIIHGKSKEVSHDPGTTLSENIENSDDIIWNGTHNKENNGSEISEEAYCQIIKGMTETYDGECEYGQASALHHTYEDGTVGVLVICNAPPAADNDQDDSDSNDSSSQPNLSQNEEPGSKQGNNSNHPGNSDQDSEKTNNLRPVSNKENSNSQENNELHNDTPQMNENNINNNQYDQNKEYPENNNSHENYRGNNQNNYNETNPNDNQNENHQDNEINKDNNKPSHGFFWTYASELNMPPENYQNPDPFDQTKLTITYLKSLNEDRPTGDELSQDNLIITFDDSLEVEEKLVTCDKIDLPPKSNSKGDPFHINGMLK